MCRVVIKNTGENIEFVVYNHIFSQEQYFFTTEKLRNDLKQYNLELSIQNVQYEINQLIKAGLINQTFKGYSTK